MRWLTLRTNDFREQNLDGLDVLQDIRLSFIRKLSGEDPGKAKILRCRNLRRTHCTVAYRTCSDYLRARYPLRTSLKNSLRRILDKANEFAAWEAASGEWMCGYPGWRSPSFKTDAARVMDLRIDPGLLPREAMPRGPADEDMNWTAWKALLDGVFRYVGGPLALDDLIAIVAPLVGMEDVPRTRRLAEDTGDEAQ